MWIDLRQTKHYKRLSYRRGTAHQRRITPEVK